MRIAAFFLLRTWFAFACSMVGLLGRIGAPAYLVNAIGRLCGTGYACRALFRLVWHPNSMQ